MKKSIFCISTVGEDSLYFMIILGSKVFFVLARWEKTDVQSKRADRGCITAGRSRLLPALTKSAIHIIERKKYYAAQRTEELSANSHKVVTRWSKSCLKVVSQLLQSSPHGRGQGCISCGILVSGIRARGVSSEHMENMEMFSCSPT